MKPNQTSSVHLSRQNILGNHHDFLKKQTDVLNYAQLILFHHISSISMNFASFGAILKIFYKLDSGLSWGLPQYFVDEACQGFGGVLKATLPWLRKVGLLVRENLPKIPKLVFNNFRFRDVLFTL